MTVRPTDLSGFVPWVRVTGIKRWTPLSAEPTSAAALSSALKFTKDRCWRSADVLVLTAGVDANVPFNVDRVPQRRRPPRSITAMSA